MRPHDAQAVLADYPPTPEVVLWHIGDTRRLSCQARRNSITIVVSTSHNKASQRLICLLKLSAYCYLSVVRCALNVFAYSTLTIQSNSS